MIRGTMNEKKETIKAKLKSATVNYEYVDS